MNNTAQYTTKPTAVFFVGPEPTQNRDGDEIPFWSVYLGDDDAEPVGKCYDVFDYDRALSLARRMSTDRRLPLENEADRA